MAINAGPKIVEDGLVFCVDAANKKSYPRTGTVWTDLTANKNNGTLTNMTDNFSTDGAGSLTFDGSDEYVISNNSLINPNEDFTISSHIQIASYTGTKTIISNHASIGSLQIRVRGSRQVQIVDAHRVEVDQFNNFLVSIDVWYNIVVVRSSNTYNLYVDGEFKSSFTSSNHYESQPTTIGTNYTGSEFFNGKISNVFAYNRALSANEVQQNYLATKGRFQ